MTAQEISENGKQLDITAPENVEILVDIKGRVIWVNIDDVCVIRCCRIKKLSVETTEKLFCEYGYN